MKAELLAILTGLMVLGDPDRMAGTELPLLADTARPFSFVVLGDLHYRRPAFDERKLVNAIAASVNDCEPPVAFVCQTGDVVNGGEIYETRNGKRVIRPANHDEVKTELDVATRDITERFRVPLFIAVGNHDKHGGGTPFPEVVLPLTSRELGVTVTQTCYGFRYGNSCFVFLDIYPANPAAQQKLIRQLLEQAQASGSLRHIFLFAHFPLWPLILPGAAWFSPDLTASLLPIFKQFPVDAYFCGHTHNTSAWVRQLEGATITQIQGVACGISRALVPMEECRTLLLPADELSYYWGYAGGPPAGFFLVTVAGERVRVQFRSGAKLIREFEWQTPGRITDLLKPAPRPLVTVNAEALTGATAATLAFCPWAEERTAIGISLNSERLVTAEIGPIMDSNAFAEEQRIAIPTEKLKLLRIANEVALENPQRAIFAIGHAYLELRLADGRTARTSLANRFLFSATRAESLAAGKKYGWNFLIPQDAIQSTRLGQPLGPMRLNFPAAAP